MQNLNVLVWLALVVAFSGCLQNAPPFIGGDVGNEVALRETSSTRGELDGGNFDVPERSQPLDSAPRTQSRPIDMDLRTTTQDASQSALDARTHSGPEADAAVIPDARIPQPDAFARPDAGWSQPRDAGIRDNSCVGQSCTCEQDGCDLTCRGRGCRHVCAEGVQNCRSSCFGPNCRQVCEDAASCTGRCEGPNCNMQCLEESSCTYVCRGENCNFRCDGGHCDFDCQNGTGCVFDCRDAESCNVRCRSPRCRLLCGDLEPAACTFDCRGGCEQTFDED